MHNSRVLSSSKSDAIVRSKQKHGVPSVYMAEPEYSTRGVQTFFVHEQ